MTVLVILSGVLLHAVQSDALASAARRQLQLKAQYIYHLLANAMAENSGRSHLRTLAEGILENRIDGPGRETADLLERIRPRDFAVEVRVRTEDGRCVTVRTHENAGAGDVFKFSGRFALISVRGEAEARADVFEVEVSLFRTG